MRGINTFKEESRGGRSVKGQENKGGLNNWHVLFQDIYSTVIVIVLRVIMEPYLSIVDLSSFNEVCSYAIISLSVKLINSLW